MDGTKAGTSLHPLHNALHRNNYCIQNWYRWSTRFFTYCFLLNGTLVTFKLCYSILFESETVYSYFMATRGTVKLLSRGSREDLGNCCQRQKATVSHIFSTIEGQWFDCSPSSLEITVLLPNCLKSPKHCQQYVDARRWCQGIWRFVTSFVTWPVNSALLTGQ